MKGILTVMSIVAMLFVSVQYAEANEMDLMIEGENKDHGIFIAIEGRDSIIMWETIDGYSEHFDSKLKTYKSGGFSLKNPESGIAVWGHVTEDTTQYRLVILTSEGAERIVASVIDNAPIEEAEKDTTTIYPKSSVGADITKYDIPTVNPRDIVREPKVIVNMGEVTNLFINNEFVPNILVSNQDFQRIVADVNLKIVRDDIIIKNISSTTSKLGYWGPLININDYQFSPGFCYDVIVTATLGNLTATHTDDFIVTTTAKYWDWTLAPIDSDSRCNR